MSTSKVKELEAARAKLAALEQSAATELRAELASLPARYGFADVRAFSKAVRSACGGGSAASGKKRFRAVIDEDTRILVKKLVAVGKTGAEIAEEAGISVPSVQNIKKALGLVKARK